MKNWILWKETGLVAEVVVSSCGNKMCVNPAHFTTMTAAEANALAPKPGYGQPPKVFGRKPGNARLSPKKLARIRELLAAGHTARNIGLEVGVAPATIRGIKNGVRYRNG
jgi:hypothetical protein